MTQPNKTHFQMPGLHSSFLKTNNSSYTLCFTLDRQWHWNSSNDATKQNTHFHSSLLIQSTLLCCVLLFRQWHWNFSNDATQEAFYFHSDECWTAFQSNTSLDFSVLLHCSGLTLQAATPKYGTEMWLSWLSFFKAASVDTELLHGIVGTVGWA